MGKAIHNHVLDAALEYIKNNGIELSVVKTAVGSVPTFSQTHVDGSDALARHTISSADFSGPTDGTSSGRTLTVSQQADVDITASGTAYQVTINDGSHVLLCTTCTSQALTSGNKVTFPAFTYNIADPS